MQKILRYKLFLSIVSVLMGLLYLFLIKVEISHIENQSFTIESKITQEVKFHIQTKNTSAQLTCNNKKISFKDITKHDYWYSGEEKVFISLKQGKNSCQGKNITSNIKQKIDFTDYTLLFLLIGIPLFTLLFSLFIKLLDWIKITYPPLVTREKQQNSIHPINKWIIGILVLGVIIRILYFQKFGIMTFQHDWQGHIEFIKYMAENWSLPIPTKGFEYPQQSLYYVLMAGLYNLLMSNGFSDMDALYGIGYFSLLCSVLFLFYGYKLINLLTQEQFTKVIAIVFISLTPSIVYLSARINNDSLVMALAIISIFYIIKSYKNNFEKYFYIALFSVSLLFLTKISGASIELLLLTLLIYLYYKSTKEVEIKQKLYIYGLVGIFLLSFTLLRVYLPLEGSFCMINSAEYPQQTLPSLGYDYFASLHLIDLILTGQSHVFGLDSIRHSFLTYQYGTMFFGEFDYANFINKTPYLKLNMQIILALGLVFIVGFISYIIHIRKEPFINKLLFIIVTINLLLIVRLIFMYPSICNTDFRYFVSSFVLLGFIIAKGLNYLTWLRKPISIVIGLLALSEIVFFIGLLK